MKVKCFQRVVVVIIFIIIVVVVAVVVLQELFGPTFVVLTKYMSLRTLLVGVLYNEICCNDVNFEKYFCFETDMVKSNVT